MRRLSEDTQEWITGNFTSEFDDKDRNVYFKQYVHSKPIEEQNVRGIIGDIVEKDEIELQYTEEDGFLTWIEREPVHFCSLAEERLLVVFSTAISQSARRTLSNLDTKYGWILDHWIPGDIIEDIYHQYSPDDGSVNIERQWDPYWIYQQGSDIPEDLQEYFNDNIDEFVEQEVKFNLKTPKRLIDETLNRGVQEELLNKSELSKSRFIFKIPEHDQLHSDGGIQAEAGIDFGKQHEARVSVRQEGEIIHTSGDPRAVFYLIDELERRRSLYQNFSSVIPEREYEELSSGVRRLVDYNPGKVLKLVFEKEGYDQEASIKLRNFFTVGHNDVKLHGVITQRTNKLGFTAEAYMPFDNSEYQVLFTHQDSNSAIYLKPVAASTVGLIYIFRKLKEKFDPRIDYTIVDDFPNIGAE